LQLTLKRTTLGQYEDRNMRDALRLLLILWMTAAASPVMAQACATLGSQVDCRAATKNEQVNRSSRPPGEQNIQVQGHAETTVSNHGVSTTFENKVIDSHGVVEFGFRGSSGTVCGGRKYVAGCE
jgi:hypothetical protein